MSLQPVAKYPLPIKTWNKFCIITEQFLIDKDCKIISDVDVLQQYSQHCSKTPGVFRDWVPPCHTHTQQETCNKKIQIM